MGKKLVTLMFQNKKKNMAFLFAILLCTFTLLPAFSAKGNAVAFVPRTPVMQVGEIKQGMDGVLKTVVRGNTVTELPVKVVSVIAQESMPRHLILIKISSALAESVGGIAAGMSGSPLYINNKFVGALGYGWNFSDHQFALVTSAEDLLKVWSKPFSEEKDSFPKEFAMTISFDDILDQENESGDSRGLILEEVRPELQLLFGNGFGKRGADLLERKLAIQVREGLPLEQNSLPLSYNTALSPGEALGVLFAWGDVSLGAVGTVSAVDDEGRFIAFAHPLLNRGNISYPVTTAYIHSIIPGNAMPFKLGSITSMVGVATRDTAQGVGGYFKKFAPSVSFEIILKMPDQKRIYRKRFHTVNDPAMVAQLCEAALLGMVDQCWGQKGEGSAFTSLKVEKTRFFPGWQRENMYFSGEDIAGELLKEVKDNVHIFATNPFLEIFPLGFSITLELSRKPRILYIDNVEIENTEKHGGDQIEVAIALRPYRGKKHHEKVLLTIPEDYQGHCEVVVRGGGIDEPGDNSVTEGWRSIASMERFLKELEIMETNNQVVVSLKLLDKTSTETEEEDHPFRSEIMASEIREKRLRILRTNYYVDGMLKREFEVLGKK